MQTTAQTNSAGDLVSGEIKHTALPWRVTDSIHNGKVFISKDGSERGSVALCEREEDAAFIVRAVNAHQNLVDALEFVVAELICANNAHGLTDDRCETLEAVKAARAALAKAGVK